LALFVRCGSFAYFVDRSSYILQKKLLKGFCVAARGGKEFERLHSFNNYLVIRFYEIFSLSVS
jgi:hypothetical protein